MGRQRSQRFTLAGGVLSRLQRRYYTHTENVADVAVLRNWPSMAYSINATSVPATLMETGADPIQGAVRHPVRRAVGWGEPLRAAIVLAGQESISDAQIRTLLKYVRGGGTLILAGNTACTTNGASGGE